MVQSQDLAVTGEFIVQMAEADRWFEILDKPSYEAYPTSTDPTGEKKKKLKLHVALANGAQADYYPNTTSARKMTMLGMRIKGNTEMDNWVGMKFVWGTILKQKVGANMKDVLYVTDTWPNSVKV